MHRILVIAILFPALNLNAASLSSAAEQRSLMGMFADWQYPDSTFKGAEMADGKTVDSAGSRTVQSLVCKAAMTTDAPIEKVIEYYRAKLQTAPKQDGGDKKRSQSGRSVVFSDDSDGRPFDIHTIIVNTDDSSTTLVITRGKSELKTHIAWKQYNRF